MERVFLIDTDTASDDAVALIMALQSPDIHVAAITVVAGNVAVDQACQNALFTAELCGSTVPVFRGAEAPLHRPLEDASWFHGKDGLGDRGYPPPCRTVEPKHAADAIIETAEAHPGLTIVTLGPLTNLALALQRNPKLEQRVSRCVVMGGAPCCEGNVTPAAEFNIWCDPEAAQQVLRSALPVELVGWHLCRAEAALNVRDIEAIGALGSNLGNFAIECNSIAQEAYFTQTGEQGISLPDPIAMSIAIQPEIGISSSHHHVDVEIESDLTRGMTVVDRLHVSADARNALIWREFLNHAPRTKIYWSIDVMRWKRLLINTLIQKP